MNGTRSSRMKQRMQELAEKFASQLPGRLADLEEAAKRFFREGSDDARYAVQIQAHKLAGAAATFGYTELSRISADLERCIQSECELTEVEDYMKRIRQAVAGGTDVEISSPDATPRAASAGPKPFRVVLLGDDAAAGAELREIEEQLGFFGLETARAEDAESVRAELGTDSAIMLLGGLGTIEQLCSEGVRFTEWKNEGIPGLTLVALSQDDSFETRLSAIRCGADAFVTYPVDIPRLIDKIDEFDERANPKPLHVLIVDDDKEQVSQIAYTLQQAGMVTSVASDPSKVFSHMVDSKPELIIVDMYMPECSGIELARLIRQQESFVGVPIVFLSIEADVAKHMEAMSQGGDDFLVKPVNPDVLTATVRIRAQRTRQMRYFMERDSLTGMLNHTHLKQYLERELQRAERIEGSVSFAMIDLDNFKHVNDTYGHLTGDRVLKSLSRLLSERLRKTDTIGRYGGEEFGVVLFNSDASTAAKIVDELRERFSHIVHKTKDTEFCVTFSCGIAAYPDVPDAASITELADRALYQAKQTGKNRVVSV